MRVELIEGRLVGLLGSELGCEVRVVDAAGWRRLDPLPRFRFGYAPPEPEECVVFWLSPELIDAVTSGLSDDELDVYLTALEIFLSAYLMFPGRSSDEVVRLIENRMLSEAPNALALMSETEARAIDAGLVARLP